MMIRWAQPEMLWMIAVWAAVAGTLFFLFGRRRRRMERMAESALWSRLAPDASPLRSRRRLVLWSLALLCATLALARPQWGFHWIEVKQRGSDWMVVLDVSNSMRAPDFKPSRIQQAKWALHDLLKKLRGDRVGLVAFAGDAFQQCPLTPDYAAFAMMLDEMEPGIMPRGGTATTRGLETALEKFDADTNTADRVILLITDGEDHEGDPRSLIPQLKKKGIRILAIGVGSLEGELVPAEDGGGFLKDASGQVVKSRLNEGLLSELARATGGRYVRAAPSDFGLEALYTSLQNSLKRSEHESKMVRVYEERSPVFLLVALGVLLLEALLPDRRRKTGAVVENSP
jgi:Ca-activated chloride channel family protein